MVDVLRKHVSSEQRILVDAKAFLNTTISDGVLYFTASQIELMRNLVQYANRRNTFVSDYYVGYYLSPDDTDWDLIQRRVADLEETLMGNANRIFGIEDVVREADYGDAPTAGDILKWFPAVPSGKVWRIEGVQARNATNACSKIEFGYWNDPDLVLIRQDLNPVADITTFWDGIATLEAGSAMFVKFYGCVQFDTLWFTMRGYQMDVPAA